MGWFSYTDDSGDKMASKQSGDRIEAISRTGKDHSHIVSNDGLNADYVRDSNGNVVADNSKSNPYG